MRRPRTQRSRLPRPPPWGQPARRDARCMWVAGAAAVKAGHVGSRRRGERKAASRSSGWRAVHSSRPTDVESQGVSSGARLSSASRSAPTPPTPSRSCGACSASSRSAPPNMSWQQATATVRSRVQARPAALGLLGRSRHRGTGRGSGSDASGRRRVQPSRLRAASSRAGADRIQRRWDQRPHRRAERQRRLRGLGGLDISRGTTSPSTMPAAASRSPSAAA